MWQEQRLWNNEFKAVLWLPLREIADYIKEIKKASLFNTINLSEIIREKCLAGLREHKPSSSVIKHWLKSNKKKILFILDGWDEIARHLSKGEDELPELKSILQGIMSERGYRVIVTSRPMEIRSIDNEEIKFDKEVENIGFNHEAIINYINKFKPNSAEKIISFLKANHRIWSIAHIPIHLELICKTWERLSTEHTYTMSRLYKEIVNDLLERYIFKVQAISRDQLTKIEFNKYTKQIVKDIEELALYGMKNNEIIIQDESIEDILGENYQFKKQELLKTGLLKAVGSSVYFLHLTFQEYFAANAVVRRLEEKEEAKQEEAKLLIKEHKYTSHYEVMWWYVAGLLYQNYKQSQDLTFLHRFWNEIEGHPVDLIGIRHINLLIRCLDECIADKQVKIHRTILSKIVQWCTIDSNKYVIKSLEASPNVSNEIVTILITSLNNRESTIRWKAAETLGKVQGEHLDKIITALVTVLNHDDDPKVRSRAAGALSKIGVNRTEELVPILITAYKNDADYFVRLTTVQALGDIGKAKVEETLPILINALKNEPNSWVRFKIVDVLGKIGDEEVEKITSVLIATVTDDEDYKVRSQAAVVLAEINKIKSEEVILALIASLNDNDYDVRSSAAKALGYIGSKKTDEILPELMTALKSNSKNVRKGAIEALGNITTQEKIKTEIIPTLITALEDNDYEVRSSAVKALGQLNEKNLIKMVLPALAATFKDNDYDVRLSVVEVLGVMGSVKADTVVPILTLALKDNHDKVRCKAIEALGKIGDIRKEEIIPLLTTVLHDRDYFVRLSAVEVLNAIGGIGTEKAISILIAALASSNYLVKLKAIENLKNISDSNPELILKEACVLNDATIITQFTTERKFLAINLQCYNYSSNPLWLKHVLETGIDTQSAFLLACDSLQVHTDKDIVKIPLTGPQRAKLVEILHSTAQQRQLPTQIYHYYLRQGTLGYEIEVNEKEKITSHVTQNSEMLQYYEKLLEEQQVLYYEDHPSLAQAFNCTGIAYEVLGNIEKGTIYLERALAMRQKLFQNNHPHIASSLYHVGAAYEKLGDQGKSLEYYKQAYRIWNTTFGEQFEDSKIAKNNIEKLDPVFFKRESTSFTTKVLAHLGLRIDNQNTTTISKRGEITHTILKSKLQLQSKTLDKIQQLAYDGHWTYSYFTGFYDYGIKGYLEDEYLRKQLGTMAHNQEELKIAKMLCFEAINLGIMKAEIKHYNVATEFAKAYPELVKEVAAQHPEYFVDILIVAACIKAFPYKKEWKDNLLSSVGIQERVPLDGLLTYRD